jgi:hypothetical protein
VRKGTGFSGTFGSISTVYRCTVPFSNDTSRFVSDYNAPGPLLMLISGDDFGFMPS